MDRNRTARFECDLDWTFACKIGDLEKSSKFKTGENGGQSTENWNSANSRWLDLAVQLALNSLKGVFFARINPVDPGDRCHLNGTW
jgi:hypothetical protein